MALNMDKVRNKLASYDKTKKGGNELLIVGAHGFTIKTAMEAALENVEKMRTIVSVDFRKDGAREGYSSSPRERYASLQEMGLI